MHTFLCNWKKLLLESQFYKRHWWASCMWWRQQLRRGRTRWKCLGPTGVFTRQDFPLGCMEVVIPAEYAGGIRVTRPCLVLSFPGSPAGSTPWNNPFFEMTSEKLSASSWHPDLRHSRGPGSFQLFDCSILRVQECESLLFLISDLRAWGLRLSDLRPSGLKM